MKRKHDIKRRYFDFRTGNTTLAPLLQFSNFMMLAYLTINEVIPMWIFAPIFIVSILVAFTWVGSIFRKQQTPTDVNMIYEKSTQAAETVYQMMLSNEIIMKKLGIPIPIDFLNRLKYMKQISEGKA